MSASRARRWYQIACSYVRSPELVQAELPFSKTKRSTLCAIASLPPSLAQRLEEAGVSWGGWQRVAHADGATAQRERGELELAKIAGRRASDTPRDPRAEANELLERGPAPYDYRRPPMLVERGLRKTEAKTLERVRRAA